MKEPIAFQGQSSRSYFEGWYFKHVSPAGDALAVIPGVSFDSNGNGHAFVQAIRGSDGATAYQRYSLEEFCAETSPLSVSVGPNRFSLQGVALDIEEAFGGIRGAISYAGTRRPRSSILRPGIMGWYRYVPRMECYHEVGSVDHHLDGTIEISGKPLDFSGGRGYLEKDWGTSMPSAWVWMQCNGFDRGGSVMLSIATIPWLGRSFTGFLGFVAPPEEDGSGSIETFGTWSGAQIERLVVRESRVEVEIRARRWSARFRGHRNRSGSLAAPVAGAMDRRIAESIDGTVEVDWMDRHGDPIWSASGGGAGIEVVGTLPENRGS